MAKIVLQSQDGIISRLRKSLNSMFTELYNAVIGGTGDLTAKSVTITGNEALTLEDTVYDDVQISIGRVRFPGVADPTWRAYNHGIGGGVTFDVLGFAVNDYINFDIQTYHAMKLSTILDSHIHYMTPGDGTGKKFKFQLDVIVAPINGSWTVPSGSPFTKEVSMDADLSNAHKMEEVADIPASNTTVSTIYTCKLTRVTASADEYSGEVYIKFIDSHYQKDTVGSRTELNK